MSQISTEPTTARKLSPKQAQALVEAMPVAKLETLADWQAAATWATTGEQIEWTRDRMEIVMQGVRSLQAWAAGLRADAEADLRAAVAIKSGPATVRRFAIMRAGKALVAAWDAEQMVKEIDAAVWGDPAGFGETWCEW